MVVIVVICCILAFVMFSMYRGNVDRSGNNTCQQILMWECQLATNIHDQFIVYLLILTLTLIIFDN